MILKRNDLQCRVRLCQQPQEIMKCYQMEALGTVKLRDRADK
jgi:hypothetical protein